MEFVGAKYRSYTGSAAYIIFDFGLAFLSFIGLTVQGWKMQAIVLRLIFKFKASNNILCLRHTVVTKILFVGNFFHPYPKKYFHINVMPLYLRLRYIFEIIKSFLPLPTVLFYFYLPRSLQFTYSQNDVKEGKRVLQNLLEKTNSNVSKLDELSFYLEASVSKTGQTSTSSKKSSSISTLFSSSSFTAITLK